MFFLNFKLPKKYILLCFLLIVLCVIVVLNICAGKTIAPPHETFQGCSDDFSVADYITSFGPDIDVSSCKVDEITVPHIFNEVYESYNEIQKSQGFDLELYKGKVLTRYTYSVINYPGDDSNVFAEVLVLDGVVVAADIYSTDSDGFILPLK